MAEEIKKSYNPLKMWGSWVGGIILLVWYSLGIGGLGNRLNFIDYFLGFVFIFVGFLIGWAIHSLIRKFKN